MIYLDYSATTPVNPEVIDTYSRACREFIGNPNSIHKLGVKSKELIDASTKQIADILGVKTSEIIYTSGSSESNNTAVKGVCLKYENRGRHIISTELEHSSIIAPLNYLASKGWEVDFVKLDKDGLVDLEDLERLIRDDTVLVTIGAVNSEVGVLQNIKAISEVIRKKNTRTIFHSDVTQCIGKVKFDFDLVDKDVLLYYNLLKNIWDKLENVPNALLIINTAIEISNLKNYDQSLEFLNKFNLCYCFDEEEVNKVKDIINGDKLEEFYNLIMTLTKRMIDKDYKKYLRSSITPKLKEILDKKNLE